MTDEVVVTVPGRVNLIGEHTDYNDGFVLPIAIQSALEVRARPRSDGLVSVVSRTLEGTAVFGPEADPRTVRPAWGRYAAGALRVLRDAGLDAPGFDATLGGDLPHGAGLASSAALTVGIALAAVTLARAADRAVPAELADSANLARLCREAEAGSVGVRCGIMDPFTALHARAGHALFLDCRSLVHRHVPVDGERVAFVLADSGVRHHLAMGEYNVRRGECEQAVETLRAQGLEVQSLRDVTADQLRVHRDALPEVLRRRARHVVTENTRTARATAALAEGAFDEFGRLLDLSHESLRDDYEVSCPELDSLVEVARGVSGVLGSRMTGGGFGGSTVTVARLEAAPILLAVLEDHGVEARVVVPSACAPCYPPA